ncbi:MAG TPA: methionine biosynthesis protein MetW [Elusimicrobia bacterium]|nr:methionine biosynthesis protein MetW [Elusimicrobiota bacterium]
MTDKTENTSYKIIADWIEEKSSVLDLGCGGGELLSLLMERKNVKAIGIELSEQAIYKCVAKGISVVHENIENGLNGYADKSFDYVILYNTFQEIKNPAVVLGEALRVGKKVIVGFPNFAHWASRFQIFFNGRVPVTSSMPFQWYDTPNLHFLSILNFEDYCNIKKIKIEKFAFIGKSGSVKLLPNLFAEMGIFLVS